MIIEAIFHLNQIRPSLLKGDTQMPQLINVHPIVRLALFSLIFIAAFLWSGFQSTTAAQSGTETQFRNVSINRTLLSDATVYALEKKYRVRIPDGNYWYDRFCGAWGV